MPRKTVNSNINQAIAVEPVKSENPFQLDDLIDIYAQPIASEVIKERLPERVKHHIRRLLTSNEEADRTELLNIMQSAKIGICFSVYHAVLAYARETAEARLNGSSQQSLPSTSSNGSDVIQEA